MNDLQQCILNIYKEVKKICEKYNIKYFAIGGTCIGAVRHKGFIPWDDDLDIAIPIEQIDNFIEKAKSELPEYLEILTGENNSCYILPFFKIIDKRTTFIEDAEKNNTQRYKGVFIDVMPISGIPINSKCKINKMFLFKRKLYAVFNQIKKLKMSESITLKRKIVKIALNIVDNCFSNDYFFKKYIKLLKKYPLELSNETGYVWSNNIYWLHFPTSYFSETIELQFEDTVMNCPIGYHEYLTKQFGNYMQKPPVHKRQTHPGFIDLKCSYKEYQKYPNKVQNNEKIYKEEIEK